MTVRFTLREIDRLIESQSYTVRAVQNYTRYPSYEFKQQREAEEHALLGKLRQWRKERRGGK